MSMATSAPSAKAPIPGGPRKKRLLLVDSSHAKREMRAEVMRKLGVEVDCAADISEARSWWKVDFYDLVLIGVEKDGGHRDRFCEDLRNVSPRQQLAFLVGKPGYLAESPGTEEDPEITESHAGLSAPIPQGEEAVGSVVLPQKWGIMEASRQISAVRSAVLARTRAMRSLPGPPRDSEGRPPKRTATPSILDDLLKKEIP